MILFPYAIAVVNDRDEVQYLTDDGFTVHMEDATQFRYWMDAHIEAERFHQAFVIDIASWDKQ